MVKSPNVERIWVDPGERSSTRYNVNRNWNRRGDKHKPKAKK